MLLVVLNFTLLTIITDSTWCFNAIFGCNFGGNGAIFYIIKRIIHGCLEIWILFRVLLLYSKAPKTLTGKFANCAPEIRKFNSKIYTS